jgi:hypothetical protein
MFKRISSYTLAIGLSLSPRQAATVAFVSTFVTVIGGVCLAIYFKRRNDRRIISFG